MRVPRTFVFVDISGFTKFTASNSDEVIITLLKRWKEAARVIAEELGLIGVVAVIGGFIAFAYSGMQVAMATVDRFHALVAGGIVCWFGTQAIINMGGVVGLMPVTGLTLPFFSVGGSSLFVTLVATGLLLNVARNVR